LAHHIAHAAAPARPHPLHRVHHLRRPHGASLAKPRHVAAAAPAAPANQLLASGEAMRSAPVYELRPIACDTRPSAIQSIAPGVTPAAPATAQKLLDALAGPVPAPVATPVPTAPSPVDTPQVIAPQPPDTGPGPDFPGLPGLPGPFVEGPLVLGPPPVTPPVGPPLVTPPDTPPGGVPEPATWAMLMTGFVALGTALRARRSSIVKP
jgi:hypothetical protein